MHTNPTKQNKYFPLRPTFSKRKLFLRQQIRDDAVMIENNSRGRSNPFANRIVAEVHLQIYLLGSLVDIYLIMKCDHEMAAVARRQKIGIIFRCHQRAIGNISHSWLPCCLFLASNLQQHHASVNCPNHRRLNFNQNLFFCLERK